MAAAVRYVSTRNGVYCYARRVPLMIQKDPHRFERHFGSKKLFRKSLRTKDQAEMHAAALAAHREFEGMIAAATGRQRPHPKLISGPLRRVTQADLEALAERYKALTVHPFEQAYLRADSGPEGAEELKRMNSELELDSEALRNAIRIPGAKSNDPGIDTPASIAEFIIANEGFDAPLGSVEYGAIVASIRAGLEQGYKQVDALQSGEALPRIPNKVEGVAKKRSLTLRDAVQRYLDHKKLPPKTSSEVDLSLRTFESVIGNKALDSLARKDFQKFVEHLADQTVGGKSEGSVKRPLAAQTVKKRLGFLNAAINHAIDRDWFDGRNPASGIKVDAFVKKVDRAVMPEKRPFKVGELNQLFQHPWFVGCKSTALIHTSGSHRLPGSHYWAPIVALWTGCRASELGGIRLAEVLIDDPYPHLVIRHNQYRRTKGGYARDVPILDGLMDLGFPEYVERLRSTNADRLFPDWTSPKMTGDFNKDDAAWSNAKIIRSFNRTVLPSALKETLVEGVRREVTFHSFRGSFKAMLGSAEYKLHPNYINEVIGHSKSELDKRYVGTLSIEETYPAVRTCRYKGLLIPPAP
jgi:integrase